MGIWITLSKSTFPVQAVPLEEGDGEVCRQMERTDEWCSRL
jgi:hypothetical protein